MLKTIKYLDDTLTNLYNDEIVHYIALDILSNDTCYMHALFVYKITHNSAHSVPILIK